MNNFIRIGIAAALSFICIGLAIYCHFYLKIEVVFTHFFYVPIVCACYWWGIKGMAIPLILGLSLIGSHYWGIKGDTKMFLFDVIRSGIFLAVGMAVSFLRERNVKSDLELLLRQKELENSERRFKIFSQNILLLREEEKKRISSDIHDDVGAFSVLLNSNFSVLEDDIKLNHADKALKQLNTIKQIQKNYTGRLKEISLSIRPPDLDLVGVEEAIRRFCDEIRMSYKLRMDIDIILKGDKVDDVVSVVLYRITQESLNNIIKHASAKNVKLQLHGDENGLSLLISDDGKGFDMDKLSEGKENRIGVEGMRQRVEWLGGEFNIESKIGGGCKVRVFMPVNGCRVK